ncbi:MAG: hypothetical protein BGN97_05715 [Microbacterium sp. 69-10]|uniref:hypothetical protein n=1 Tax=Microbacterium sp. 69-10 TaxID=1895783 RepID=UPI00095BA576|nr:hypothetical protein [Microbacterium sp. 69-10]OJU39579.1 MAG: hypothetical protein BGN97_05715 [Microbacterium sp. 69-10]
MNDNTNTHPIPRQSGALLIPDAQAFTVPRPLPGHQSLLARTAHAAYWAFAPGVRSEIRAGHFGAAAVGEAFRQLEEIQPAAVHLTRSERAQGFAALFRLQSKHGGVL